MTKCTSCEAETETTVEVVHVFDVVRRCDGCGDVVSLETARE